MEPTLLKDLAMIGATAAPPNPGDVVQTIEGDPKVADFTTQRSSGAITPPRKTVGSTWLFKYDGLYWPVVLSDDKTSPAKFVESRTKPEHRPAILLGKHKLVWITDELLAEYNPCKDYTSGISQPKQSYDPKSDSAHGALEEIRRAAFRYDAPRFLDHKHWMKHILKQSEARKLEKLAARRTSCGSKRPHQNDDHDHGARSMKASTQSHRSDQRSSGQILRRDKAGSYLPTLGIAPTSKGGFSYDITPAKGQTEGLDPKPKFIVPRGLADPFTANKPVQNVNLKEVLKEVQAYGPLLPPSPDVCTVIVGAKYEPYRVPYESVRHCEGFVESIKVDDTLGVYVNLSISERPEIAKIIGKDFEAVASYMRGEGHKLSRHMACHGVPLELINDEEAERLIGIYVTATKIGYVGLQCDILVEIQKLQPLSEKATVYIARVLCEVPINRNHVEKGMKTFVVTHLTKHFWQLAMYNSDALQRVLELNAGLRQSLIRF